MAEKKTKAKTTANKVPDKLPKSTKFTVPKGMTFDRAEKLHKAGKLK